MAELATCIFGLVKDIAVRWIAAPINRQFNYMCCFTSNIKQLEKEANVLAYRTELLQDRVSTDKNEGRGEIYETVQIWKTNSDDITNRKNRILAEAAEAVRGCSNVLRRRSLSRKATKIVEEIRELIQNSDSPSVTHPLPIGAHAPVQFVRKVYEFNSRKCFEEQIMKTLTVGNVYKVGICGTRGVGKTIMAQNILKRARDSGLFHNIAVLTVSHQVDKFTIQKNIVEALQLPLKEETLYERADKLHTRLTQEKRTLVLLDDVWEDLSMEELGIPSDSEWCTVIVTSRQKDVLKRMKVESICQLGVLDEDEAWHFFMEITGTFVDDLKLKPIAYEVMKECKGLLLALEIIGKAHIDEKHPDHWNLSLIELRKHNPIYT